MVCFYKVESNAKQKIVGLFRKKLRIFYLNNIIVTLFKNLRQNFQFRIFSEYNNNGTENEQERLFMSVLIEAFAEENGKKQG